MLFLGFLGYNLNKKIEKFEESKETSDAMIWFWTFLAIYLLFAFLWSYGAAKLSWGYNYYLGNGYGTSFLFSFLAFIFSEFYYPFYAYFLNPIYNIKKANKNL